MNLARYRYLSLSIRKESIGYLLFWAIMLFQFTVLKYIWHIEWIATITNFLMLIVFLMSAVVNIAFIRYRIKVWLFYLLPGMLILFFEFFNITVNIVGGAQSSFYGLLLQWGAFLTIPLLIKAGFINFQKLWRLYYYFMLFAVLLALSEYFFVLRGIYPLQMLNIPNGVFLSGKFALFHMLDDGTAHDRFYACLAEPGDLAMYLLPAGIYAFYRKKYLSVLIFLVAIYFTRSLGGLIGLSLTIVLMPLFSKSAKSKVLLSALFFIIGGIGALSLSSYFRGEYENKNESREAREQSFLKTFVDLPIATVTYPLGMPLEATTEANDKNKLYFGSNFTPGYAFVLGGIFSFIGYLTVLLVCLAVSGLAIFRLDLSLEERVAFCSMIVLFTFVFQRTSAWDSAIFSLLYSPAILKFLDPEFGRKYFFNHTAIK